MSSPNCVNHKCIQSHRCNLFFSSVLIRSSIAAIVWERISTRFTWFYNRWMCCSLYPIGFVFWHLGQYLIRFVNVHSLSAPLSGRTTYRMYIFLHTLNCLKRYAKYSYLYMFVYLCMCCWRWCQNFRVVFLMSSSLKFR